VKLGGRYQERYVRCSRREDTAHARGNPGKNTPQQPGDQRIFLEQRKGEKMGRRSQAIFASYLRPQSNKKLTPRPLPPSPNPNDTEPSRRVSNSFVGITGALDLRQ
jgi:hypothetical protein